MVKSKHALLSSWGRIARPGREVFSENLTELTENAVLSRGLGRSYGDSALPPPNCLDVATTTRADRILKFNKNSGLIRVEAGVSLRELNRLFLPQGWFTPVTPGTQYVTIGGMVASDVHGKNHHVEGTFGGHVTGLALRVADERIVECSPNIESDLFWATIGGMGLTGHVLEVEFSLKRIASPWIFQESVRYPDIDALMEGLEESSARWPYTVAWADCLKRGSKLGRGILYRGRWALPDEAPPNQPTPIKHVSVPFELPNWFLNRFTARLFNEIIYRRHFRKSSGIQHPESFFYPLDQIWNWNRVYGSRGFTQYQCVLPGGSSNGAARRLLEQLLKIDDANSFLCVIKDCATQGKGLLSFPCPGVSIAVDLAVNDRIQSVIDQLNETVIIEGGRIYLTKDTFTKQEHFRMMEPRLPRWLAIRKHWDPQLRIRSAQSVRILGDPT